MTEWEDPDPEKIAFELIEQYAPEVAELLLEMAAQSDSLPELTARLYDLALENDLPEEDFRAAAIALRYARRSLTAPVLTH